MERKRRTAACETVASAFHDYLNASRTSWHTIRRYRITILTKHFIFLLRSWCIREETNMASYPFMVYSDSTNRIEEQGDGSALILSSFSNRPWVASSPHSLHGYDLSANHLMGNLFSMSLFTWHRVDFLSSPAFRYTLCSVQRFYTAINYTYTIFTSWIQRMKLENINAQNRPV